MKKITHIVFALFIALPVVIFAQSFKPANRDLLEKIQELQKSYDALLNENDPQSKTPAEKIQQSQQSKPEQSNGFDSFSQKPHVPYKVTPDDPNTGIVSTPDGKKKLIRLNPYQTPVPQNPAFVKDVEYILNNDTTNPFYVSKLDGRKIFKFINPWFLTERSTINPEFADIAYFHTNFAPPEQHIFNYMSDKDRRVLVPTDTATGKLVFSVPRFNMADLKSQLDAGAVTLPDGEPLPSSFFYLEWNGSDVMAFLGDRYPRFKIPLRRVEQFSNLAKKPKPSLFPDLTSILVEPEAPIVGVPGGFAPSTDGLVLPPDPLPSPFSSPQSILQNPTSIANAFATWWQSNPWLGRGSLSVFIQIPFAFGGHKGTMPPPGITIDGKAFNFYFTINGIPYALSFTDLNGDRVYEANIWKLKFELDDAGKLTGVTRYDGEPSPSFKVFDAYARSRKLVLPQQNNLSTPAKK